MADQILTLNGKQAAAGSGVINLIPPDYISGLEMIWNSATSLSVTTGAACRPSDSLLMMPAALITKAGLTLTASTWYHLYLYMNGANPDVEIVTTAPAAAYFGAARAKTGDTTRRYIGSILTDASGNIYNVIQVHNEINYRVPFDNAPLRALSYGQATAYTDVLLTGLPPTSRIAICRLTNNDTSLAARFTTSDSSGDPVNGCYGVAAGQSIFMPVNVDSSQKLRYAFPSGTPTGGAYVDVYGYIVSR